MYAQTAKRSMKLKKTTGAGSNRPVRYAIHSTYLVSFTSPLWTCAVLPDRSMMIDRICGLAFRRSFIAESSSAGMGFSLAKCAMNPC